MIVCGLVVVEGEHGTSYQLKSYFRAGIGEPRIMRSSVQRTVTTIVIAARTFATMFACSLGCPSNAAIRVTTYAAIIMPMSGIILRRRFYPGIANRALPDQKIDNRHSVACL